MLLHFLFCADDAIYIGTHGLEFFVIILEIMVSIVSELKSAEKEVAKLEAKKAKADQKAAEEAKKAEAEDVLKKLLASGMSVDEILAKLK